MRKLGVLCFFLLKGFVDIVLHSVFQVQIVLTHKMEGFQDVCLLFDHEKKLGALLKLIPNFRSDGFAFIVRAERFLKNLSFLNDLFDFFEISPREVIDMLNAVIVGGS